jgi:hypothetical protein
MGRQCVNHVTSQTTFEYCRLTPQTNTSLLSVFCPHSHTFWELPRMSLIQRTLNWGMGLYRWCKSILISFPSTICSLIIPARSQDLSFQCEFGSLMCPLFDRKLPGASHRLYKSYAPVITPSAHPRQSQVSQIMLQIKSNDVILYYHKFV